MAILGNVFISCLKLTIIGFTIPKLSENIYFIGVFKKRVTLKQRQRDVQPSPRGLSSSLSWSAPSVKVALGCHLGYTDTLMRMRMKHDAERWKKCNNGKCSHPLGFAEVLRLSTEYYFFFLSYSFVAPNNMIDMLRLLRAFTSEREAADSVHCSLNTC